MKRSTAFRVAAAIWCVLMIAGAGWLWLAYNAGREELKALCAKDGYPKVYREVSAEGYFDGTTNCISYMCAYRLIRSPFRYIELEQTAGDGEKSALPDGLYRFEKVKRETNRCNLDVGSYLHLVSYGRKFISSGMCVSVRKIDQPESTFGLYSEKKPEIEVENIFNSRLVVRRFEIRRLDTNELIAEQSSYVLFPNSIPSFSSFTNTASCYSRGVRKSGHPVHLNRVWPYVKPS